MVEPAGETQAVQVAADGGGIGFGRLDVDDEPVVGVLSAERRDIAVRRAGEVAQRLHAATDQPPGDLQRVSAVQRPPSLADRVPPGRTRVVEPAASPAITPESRCRCGPGPADDLDAS